MKNVFEEVEQNLQELSSLTLAFPLENRINVLQRLKEIKRSGKVVRLEKLTEKVQARSVYDHILSLGYFAKKLQKFYPNLDYSCVAKLIAYHDINEVLVGDIPNFTNYKNTSVDYLDDERVKSITKQEREAIANKFISVFANEKQRESINFVIRTISNKDNLSAKFFYYIDLLDSIVCVWRYLHLYRNDKDLALKILATFNDYFIYPHTLNVENDQQFKFVGEAVRTLCCVENAKDYILGKSYLEITKECEYLGQLKDLIEQTPIFFSKGQTNE